MEDYLSEIEFVIQEKQGGGGKERISEFWIREEKTERFLLVRFKKPPVVAFLYSDDDSFFLCLESKRNAFPFTRRNDNGECVWGKGCSVKKNDNLIFPFIRSKGSSY